MNIFPNHMWTVERNLMLSIVEVSAVIKAFPVHLFRTEKKQFACNYLAAVHYETLMEINGKTGVFIHITCYRTSLVYS